MPGDKWDPIAAIGRFAGVLQMAPDGAHRRVWNELAPWFRALVVQAGPKWIPRMSMGMPCHIVVLEPHAKPCGNSAVAGCHVCHRPTCLAHSFCNVAGEIVCYGCVSRMAGLADGGNDAEEERKRKLARARKVLGVKVGATWDAIDRAYRRKVKRAHPDVGGSAEAFRKIQEAYDLLKEEFESSKPT